MNVKMGNFLSNRQIFQLPNSLLKLKISSLAQKQYYPQKRATILSTTPYIQAQIQLHYIHKCVQVQQQQKKHFHSNSQTTQFTAEAKDLIFGTKNNTTHQKSNNFIHNPHEVQAQNSTTKK